MLGYVGYIYWLLLRNASLLYQIGELSIEGAGSPVPFFRFSSVFPDYGRRVWGPAKWASSDVFWNHEAQETEQDSTDWPARAPCFWMEIGHAQTEFLVCYESAIWCSHFDAWSFVRVIWGKQELPHVLASFEWSVWRSFNHIIPMENIGLIRVCLDILYRFSFKSLKFTHQAIVCGSLFGSLHVSMVPGGASVAIMRRAETTDCICVFATLPQL